jgi:glycosyltransferase involved in cell wall biosynthesis
MEALASGRRVVATRVGGIPDLVVSTQQGWLCEAHDPSSLREAVESSLESRYDPNEVANGAQILSLEENARHLARILEEARREHAGG